MLYAENEQFREKTKLHNITKYTENEQFREKTKLHNITKYAENEQFREKTKLHNITKYAENEQFREKTKLHNITKYAENEQFREKTKLHNITKYAENEQFREKTKLHNKAKYAEDDEYREHIIEYNKNKYAGNKTRAKQISYVIEQFKLEISSGLENICSVCHRIMFRNQVKQCKPCLYSEEVRMCISKKYLHSCVNCEIGCPLAKSSMSSLWICHTCDRKLRVGKIPQEASFNGMEVDLIPEELSNLNSLESHLIALHIPFLKLLALPKGGQYGVHGPISCVPSNISKTVHALPRFESDDQFVRVKLKRKLSYKGHHEYKSVNKSHIENALEFLRNKNEHYTNVSFNADWVTDLCDKTIADNGNGEADCISISETQNIESDQFDGADETEENEGRLRSDPLDTCLQPLDIGQDFLDKSSDGILCVAPGENNNPVRILMDTSNEAKSFPTLFPYGTGTFADFRQEKITRSRYINCRLLSADNRFAKNTDYLFYSQYVKELEQVISSISIALRKGKADPKKQYTLASISDGKKLTELFASDEGYKFLKPVHGSPPYWQAVQKDLFAMIRQLGIPTWFSSFSSADLRWDDLIGTILRQQGKNCKIEDLSWEEKNEVLRSNPVTVARMFDHRFHCFLRKVIMSPAEPIGPVKDFFYRIEFQQRGSPHTHCLFWIKDAPKLDQDPDYDVIAFIDKYITCELPIEQQDSELHEIIIHVQTHSKRHSKSCRKKNTKCRFNFPRPPSNRTFIARPQDATEQLNTTQIDEVTLPQDAALKRKMAEEILKSYWEAVNQTDITYDTTDKLFQCTKNKPTVIRICIFTTSKKSFNCFETRGK